jgi:hypothetical protein
MSPSRKGSSRVGGVGDGPPRAGEVDATTPTGGVGEVERAERVDAVRATRAAEVEGVRRVDAAAAPIAPDAVAEVAAALRAGEISVDQAVDRLIDDAVTRRVGRAIEPGSELEARLRRVLRDYAEADPLISDKIRRLEARRAGR